MTVIYFYKYAPISALGMLQCCTTLYEFNDLAQVGVNIIGKRANCVSNVVYTVVRK